ncbi:MAG TPA: cytochrome c-type biogenesis protein CcmH [Terriglobales bacterium]|nr:cytochrome c-type biogenesis protein CcmH [Terriglobales bacterium]
MRVKYILHSLLLVVVCVGLMGANPSPEERYKDLGHKLMCKCGCNQILIECNHVGCSYSTKMLEQLRAGLQRGDNDDLILQGFVQEYGATVLAAPTTTGFNRVAWIMPGVALIFAITLVTVIVRKWKFKVAPVGAQDLSPAEMDEFRKRAREETEV